MQLALIDNHNYNYRNEHSLKGFFLTNRDRSICRFLLQMKFAGIEEIHKKFFNITLLGKQSMSLRAALNRLKILEDNDFISSKRYFHHARKIYFPTRKAYRTLNSISNDEINPYPIINADIRTFEHDFYLTKLRILFENYFLIKNWISDTELRINSPLKLIFGNTNVPDAIYSKSEQDKVAFELEISLKARNKYREKIRKYVEILRNQRQKSLFSKVHYVCAKDNVYKILKEETKIYGDLFLVQKLDEIMPLTKLQQTTTN